jgi:two-component system, NarL family, nitrate/nitrite response regulator NarL
MSARAGSPEFFCIYFHPGASNYCMSSRVSVVLGSDLPQISRHVSTCFKSTPDLHLVGTTTDGTGVLHLAKVHHPNIAIISLGVRQPVLKGLVSALSDDGVCPVIMSDVLEDIECLELLQSGLVGILPPKVTAEMLRQGLHAIAAGEIWIRRDMIGKVIDQIRGSSGLMPVFPKLSDKNNSRKLQPDNQYSLTQREFQIVQATSEGMTNKEIASALDISEFTVKHHLAKIFDKLGVYSRLELATFAVHHNLFKQSATPLLAAAAKPAIPGRDRTGTF